MNLGLKISDLRLIGGSIGRIGRIGSILNQS
jgi:hypothetical protein